MGEITHLDVRLFKKGETRMTKRVLVLGSNATRIEVQDGGTGSTGNYLNETVVPAMALIEAGYNLVLATPNVPKPHIDEASDSAVHFGGDQAAHSHAKGFWANDPAMDQVRTLLSGEYSRQWDNSPGPFFDTGTTEHFHYVDANSESTHRDHRAAH
jgi:hypothetical protein